MSLTGAAAAMGLPEALVERSAQARAAEAGVSADEILAAWAGGEAVEAAAPAEPEPVSEPAPSEETDEPEDETPEVEAPTPAAQPAPAAAAAAPSRAPVPAEVTAAEAAHLPEVVTVLTAGIRERTNFVIPKWLIGLMLVAPLFALFALGGAATGACGEATELRPDIITGAIVNCDGSEFTGAAIDVGAVDFIALGADVYPTCAGCHGADGQGVGTFPAMGGVLTTFGSCEDHVEWVLLGSGGWQTEYGDTYGDTGKRVEGGMPPHASLTDEQLRAVVAFERVRFAGADRDGTLVDCGLIEGEGDENGVEPGEEAPTEDEDGMEAATGAGS